MPSKRESFGEMQVIRYETPDLDGVPKSNTQLIQTDILGVGIQVVSKEGGENNLHAHSGQDAVWFVLAGQARFYGADGETTELGPRDALFVPRGTPYWFEAIGEEPLEIMRNAANDLSTKNRRVNYEPLRDRERIRDTQIADQS